MDDGTPTLEVGFAIDTGGSFASLERLQQVMDSTEGKVLADASRIEKATASMVDIAGGTAKLTSFGNAMSRTAQAAVRDAARVEKTGEALLRRIERENAAYGKSRSELRAMRAEEAALAADRVGNTELAQRIRMEEADLYAKEFAAVRRLAAEREAAAQEAAAAEVAAAKSVNAQLAERARLEAALERNTGLGRTRATDAGATFSALSAKFLEDEAQASERAAVSTRRLAEEKERLVALVRGSHAAQEADAAAAERLRMSTDPLYGVTKRLNAEIAESTRLYYAGVIGQAEYARQQDVLTGRLQQASAVHAANDVVMKRGAGTMAQLSFQLNDIATMAALGAPPMQIFASQAGQIFQVAQMADGGVKGFAMQLGGLALSFAPLIAVAAVAGVAIWRFKEQVNDDAQLKKYAEGLGLTRKEMKKLGDTSVTTGDLFSGLWKTIEDRLGTEIEGKKIIDYLFGPNDAQIVGNFIAEVYGLFVGGYKGIVAVWGMLPAAMGDLLAQATNGTIGAIEAMVNKSIGAINALAKGANSLLGFELLGQIDSVQLGRVTNAYAGMGKKVVDTFTGAIREEKQKAMTAMTGFFADVGENAQAAARDRISKKAKEIIADRTPKKTPTDKTAERLARENEAIEAQIRNLYLLADAYRISDAAALIAEARVKAESEAIKKKSDVELFVNRQIRLEIAQRVSDAEKAAAGQRNQATAQEDVNRLVAAGLIPAERANELVQERIADLPLLAAIEAAQQRGLTAAAANAVKALDDQRRARERLTVAEREARYLAAKTQGEGRLADLREELRLVGATEAVRVRALATLRATREAEQFNPGDRPEYIRQQVEISDVQQQIAQAQYLLNDELGFTAEKWDLIARNAQDAGRGMADAFGEAGRALGDMAALYTGFNADRERAELERDERIRRAGGNEAAIARANALYATATATRQIGLYGDMAKAAKGFFGENTKGYKALETAEKVFRAVEFALSVRAIAQDAIETGSAIAKSGARAAAHAVEAVAKAIASLPFPANLAAGAATAAALAAIGLSIAGSFGGSKNTLTKANEGTGTVLGDAEAKSESIRRAIDSLKEVDTLMLSTSREMAGYLRSIESQIGGVAALVVRAGNIDANAGVQQGFKANAIGGLLGNVPLIGGFLKSLFGSTTTVIGSGLYGGAQSLGSILGGGFDASYYSDVEKKKKFLGITTGKSYSTQYSGADAGLENQFTLILRGFNDAIRAAAGPLGASTDEIEQRLNGFIVNIGKIDTKGLTGEQIEEKLTAVFGAAADGMAAAAIPGIERFQKVGEGAFETLVRVASTVETVTSALNQMGFAARNLSIDAKMALADQFDSARDFATAADAYVKAYYTKAEQNAATMAQFGKVFVSLGVTMPSTLASFRALVEAQDLTSASGQTTYATLLKLAPAFADLMSSMEGAKSAADVIAERQDLERRLLELNGDTAAIRALDLAKLDASNRALQQQIWAIQDAQEAARAAEDLRKAWTSVGDSLLDEVKRIRGLDGQATEGGFATLMSRFNVATLAARGGDQDAAKSLPGLSQELLRAAENAARSRQELDRVRAQTAASLEETYTAIAKLGAGSTAQTSTAALMAAMQDATTVVKPRVLTDGTTDEVKSLRSEVADLKATIAAGLATIAGNTGRVAKKLDDVTPNGDALSVEIAA